MIQSSYLGKTDSASGRQQHRIQQALLLPAAGVEGDQHVGETQEVGASLVFYLQQVA